ncbi:MAG: hypothetical protein AAF183_17970 [Pseudomonadota bacterium]
MPALVLALLWVAVTPATAQNMNWLNAHEAGTYRYLDSVVRNLYSRLAKVQGAWSVTQGHRKSGANHDHIDQVEKQMCYLAIDVLNLQRGFDSQKNEQTPKLVSPAATQDYLEAIREIFNVARSYADVMNCAELDWNDRVNFTQAVNKAKMAKDAISRLTTERSKGNFSWSNTFAVELSPLPLKLEFLEGSLKIKISRKIGPLNFDFQTGPKRQAASHYNGLEYLQITGPDKRARVFDVRGQSFSFPTGIGRIDVSGAFLKYTCDERCAAAYDQLN